MHPDDLRTKSSRAAVHYLRLCAPIVAGAFAAKKATLEVACGYALDNSAHRAHTTQNPDIVTCKDCRAIIAGVPAG